MNLRRLLFAVVAATLIGLLLVVPVVLFGPPFWAVASLACLIVGLLGYRKIARVWESLYDQYGLVGARRAQVRDHDGVAQPLEKPSRRCLERS